MSRNLNIRYFAHSWVSDWNHGNAHFLRGLVRSLVRMGHNVRCYEELGSWSLTHLVRNEGEAAIDAIDQFHAAYPELDIRFYNFDAGFADFTARELRHADIVILHEWNPPALVNAILALKDQLGFRALFHDTHHRAYTAPSEILQFHLHKIDGVLAFGEAIRRIYSEGFGIPHVWTFHEAADVGSFTPRPAEKRQDIVWVGNWGDEERTRELDEFLFAPARTLTDRTTAVYGVRYPASAIEKLKAAGIEYRGYLPNLSSPGVYGQSLLTVHVPRRQYSNGLSGVPTIRVFEALACGVPLLCSPWTDVEHLFSPGQDFLVAPDGRAMAAEMRHLLADAAARAQLAASGLATIRARHTCQHRAQQLSQICEDLAR